jgi:hypothetical protein
MLILSFHLQIGLPSGLSFSCVQTEGFSVFPISTVHPATTGFIYFIRFAFIRPLAENVNLGSSVSMAARQWDVVREIAAQFAAGAKTFFPPPKHPNSFWVPHIFPFI